MFETIAQATDFGAYGVYVWRGYAATVIALAGLTAYCVRCGLLNWLFLPKEPSNGR